MKFTNGWHYVQKDGDRVDITFRISVITIFELKLDWSSKSARVTVFNFTLSY